MTRWDPPNCLLSDRTMSCWTSLLEPAHNSATGQWTPASSGSTCAWPEISRHTNHSAVTRSGLQGEESECLHGAAKKSDHRNDGVLLLKMSFKLKSTSIQTGRCEPANVNTYGLDNGINTTYRLGIMASLPQNIGP